MADIDAVVVGAGQNGLAAAITLARAGRSVQVVEASDEPGGGCRTAELTLPGYRHDVCATVQALLTGAPFFRTLDLDALGVRLLAPEVAFASPLDDGSAGVCYRDLSRTVEELGRDGQAWRRLLGPLAEHADDTLAEVLSDMRHVPRHPISLARFGTRALLPVTTLARAAFRTEQARALFAGVGAHSMRKLEAPFTSAFGLALALTGHHSGWPVVEGGSGRLIEAMVNLAQSLGVRFEYGHRVSDLAELPRARATLLDVGPKQLLAMGGDRIPPRYRHALEGFDYGPGVFKMDWVISEPVPWTNPDCRRAGTVHVGGTLEQVAASEAAAEAGRHSDAPFVLVVQPTLMDPSRAPAGGHILWAYCHVPNGSTLDRSKVIEQQIERFAPGFRDTILARATRNAIEYEDYDNNFVGGDINAGRATFSAAVLGPVPKWSRYRTALEGVYLCSSSTAPGGGVHGMCGYNAAREALGRELR
jgi:phytoene dehydrogenase-like protein